MSFRRFIRQGIFGGLAALFVLGFFAHQAQAAVLSSVPASNVWVANGSISAITSAPDGSTYIGGSFTAVGPSAPYGVPVSTSSGAAVATFPQVGGIVNASIADGSGGWYIGGSFASVGGLTRNRIAHILSSGAVDPTWDPNANGTVVTFALDAVSSTLYVGGSFTTIGGQSRNYIAALSTSTGLASVWDPNADNLVSVFALDTVSSTLYVGGSFLNIGGQARNYLAAISTTTGLATGWDSGFNNGAVRALALNTVSSTLYAGGEFTGIGGQTRWYIGALSTVTGLASAWDPHADNTVSVLALDITSSVVYVGGSFLNIGGQARNRIAAICTADNCDGLATVSGNATAWDPNAGSTVQTLAIDVTSSTLYAGGLFLTIGGQTRNRIAALSTSTGLASAWNPNANNSVSALALDSATSTLYVGGIFTNVGGVARNRIAHILANGTLDLTWDPNADSTVRTFFLDTPSSTLYVGGSFLNIGGQTRNRIAALSTSTGLASIWDPNAGGTVNVIISSASSSMLYVGGSFTTIGGQTRNHIAAICVTTNCDGAATASGAATAWDPNAGTSGNVSALALDTPSSTLYVGGASFTSIGGQSRSRIAALSTTTGLATAWNPNASDTVRAFALDAASSTLYVGGDFATIGGQSRSRIAALCISANCDGAATASGAATTWDPSVVGTGLNALALDMTSSTIYVGGTLTSIGGQTRNRIAAVSTTTGLASTWDPNISITTVSALALDATASTVYAGGSFPSVGSLSRINYAQFNSLVTVSTISGNTTEAGGTATFTVVLGALPTASVSVGVTSSDTTEGTVSTSSLTFTTGNWSTPQTVTVTGVDDFVDDGNIAYTIVLAAATSTDLAYNGINPNDVSVTNTDNDTAGFTVSKSTAAVTEGSTTDSYTVVLNTEPTASVSVVVSGDAAVTGAPTPLTFTTGNWNTPQTVTVTAVNDSALNGTHTGTLTHTATSVDSVYNGISIGSVVVTVTDNEHSSGGAGMVPIVPSIHLISPNGGEIETAGTTVAVQWDFIGPVSFVNLAFTLDSGITWIPVVTNLLAYSGSYSWTVPALSTTTAIFRVQATDLASVFAQDVSDATFTIISPDIILPENGTDVTQPVRSLPPGTPITGLAPSPVTGNLEVVTPVAPGDFIRSPFFSTVYLVTQDFKRRPFQDVATFFTYASSFDQVRMVTDATLTLLPLGNPMTPKAGTVFVKIVSAPQTYLIVDGPTGPIIRWITSESIARSLAGSQWADYVIDIPVTSFKYYLIGPDINAATDAVVDRSLLKKRTTLTAQTVMK